MQWIGILLLVLLPLLACAAPPPTTPTSVPSPAPAAVPAPAAAPVAVAKLAPEDTAWASVIAASKKEGPLVVYTFAFVGDTGIKVARAIKEKYGLAVEFIGGRSPAIVERLRTEYRSNQLVASLAEGSGARMRLLKEWGFTDSLRELPVLRQKDVWKADILLYDPEAHLLVYTGSPITAVVNSQLVKPNEEPRSWLDILEPKWKGKILTQDPVQGLETYTWYIGMVSSKTLAPDYFDRFARQDIHFTMGGPADTARAVARGERPMAVPGAAIGAIPVIQSGGPIKLLSLKEGFPVSPLPFAFLKNAPQPNSAKVFMNWLLSPEGMRTYAEVALTYSYRKDVPDAAPPNAMVDWSKALPSSLQAQIEIDKIWNEQLMVKILKK